MASPLTGLVPLIGLVVRVFYLRSEILRGALLIPGLLTDWISCGRKLGYVVLQLIPGLTDRIIGDPDNFRGSVRLGIGTIDRAMRSGMEPVVNSTVKMLGTGWAPRATG